MKRSLSRAWVIVGIALLGCDSSTDPSERKVTNVVVSPSSATLTYVGETLQLDVSVQDQHGDMMSGIEVVWSSGDESVVTVDEGGLATAVAEGSGEVVAVASGIEGKATLTIGLVVTDVVVTPGEALLEYLGATLQLAATALDASGSVVSIATIEWTSSDPSIVRIDAGGMATAVAEGEATIAATASGVAGSAILTARIVVSEIRVYPEETGLLVGNERRLSATVVDVGGNEVASLEVEWSSDSEAVEVEYSGRVTAIQAGAAEVAASARGVSGVAQVHVDQPDFVIGGRVHAVDGPGIDGLTVSAVAEVDTFRARVKETGDFDLGISNAEDLTIVVDRLENERDYLPVWFEARTSDLTSGLDIVLVPRSWTIPAGRYAGRTVDISLETAFTLAGWEPPLSFYRIAGANTGPYPVLITWPPDSFPLKVAFDHDQSTTTITGADSIAAWTALDEMEYDFGFDYFQPAVSSEVPRQVTAGVASGIYLIVDQGIPIIGSAGFLADDDGFIVLADIKVQEPVGWTNEWLLKHEIIHGLGIGHTSSWPTIMGSGSHLPSVEDVAHTLLSYRIDRVTRSVDAHYGMWESWQGERVLMLGLPSVSR